MQVRLTLTTEIQSPFPAMVFSKLQDALRSRTKAVQEITIVTSLEPWQVKQIEAEGWVDEFTKNLRATEGMTIHDVKVEVIKEEP